MEVNDMKYFPRNLDVFDDMFDGFFTKEPVYNNPIMRTDVYEKNGYYNLDGSGRWLSEYQGHP